MSKSEFTGCVEIFNDSKMVYSYSAGPRSASGLLDVPKETLDRWRSLEAEFEAYQNELRALAEKNPEASENCTPENRRVW